MYTLSQKGAKFLRGGEGFEGAPYLDGGGVPTIGFGSTRYEDGRKVTMKDAKITEERALAIFNSTVKKYIECVNESIKVELTQNQFDACVSLCYNIGEDAFANSTLVKVINSEGTLTAIKYQFSRWNKDNGKVVKGLTNRRAKEANLYSEGRYE
jgi:lysozyme